MFTSIHRREETSADPSERLRFVAGWFRTLGFILVGVWILVGLVSVAVGLTTRQNGGTRSDFRSRRSGTRDSPNGAALLLVLGNRVWRCLTCGPCKGEETMNLHMASSG